MKIGDRIRRARLSVGMSQRELATALGVTHGTVGQWESHRKNPGRDNLRRLAEITLTSLDALSRDKWPETDGVLVKDQLQIIMLRRFALLSTRQQENLLELLGVAMDLRRGVQDPSHSSHSRPPTIQNGEVTPG
jgi:transcriptional regulator with XRE-family HTH domain